MPQGVVIILFHTYIKILNLLCAYFYLIDFNVKCKMRHLFIFQVSPLGRALLECLYLIKACLTAEWYDVSS